MAKITIDASNIHKTIVEAIEKYIDSFTVNANPLIIGIDGDYMIAEKTEVYDSNGHVDLVRSIDLTNQTITTAVIRNGQPLPESRMTDEDRANPEYHIQDEIVCHTRKIQLKQITINIV